MKNYLILASMLLLTGCAASGEGTPMAVSANATTTAPIAANSSREAYTGTWVGQLASGATVSIEVPANGQARYAFSGQNVPIAATREAEGSLILTLRSGGTVTLQRSGEGLAYDYRFGSEAAAAMLTRS